MITSNINIIILISYVNHVCFYCLRSIKWVFWVEENYGRQFDRRMIVDMQVFACRFVLSANKVQGSTSSQNADCLLT